MASCTQVSSLLQAYIDGELSDAEKVVFEQHIVECRACEALLHRQKATSALLFEVLGENRLRQDLSSRVLAHLPEMDRAAEISRQMTLRVKQPSRRGRVLFTFVPALAAVLLLILGVALLLAWPAPTPAGPAPIGMVTYQEGMALRGNDQDTERRRVTLRSRVNARERFETEDRAALVIGISGPTQLKIDEKSRVKIDNKRQVSLETGRIWLHVAKERDSFRVITPSSVITVFGTKFSVEVLDDITKVIVESGKVLVENDVAFTNVGPGESVQLALGQKPLEKVPANTGELMAWAAALLPDRSAEQLFTDTIKPGGAKVIRAMQVFVVPTGKHALPSITFEWQPDPFTSGHSSYHIYISDDRLQPLFPGFIDAQTFANKSRHAFELVVPDDVDLRDVSVLHIDVVPDFRTGRIETPFTDVYALTQ